MHGRSKHHKSLPVVEYGLWVDKEIIARYFYNVRNFLALFSVLALIVLARSALEYGLQCHNK